MGAGSARSSGWRIAGPLIAAAAALLFAMIWFAALTVSFDALQSVIADPPAERWERRFRAGIVAGAAIASLAAIILIILGWRAWRRDRPEQTLAYGLSLGLTLGPFFLWIGGIAW